MKLTDKRHECRQRARDRDRDGTGQADELTSTEERKSTVSSVKALISRQKTMGLRAISK